MRMLAMRIKQRDQPVIDDFVVADFPEGMQIPHLHRAGEVQPFITMEGKCCKGRQARAPVAQDEQKRQAPLQQITARNSRLGDRLALHHGVCYLLALGSSLLPGRWLSRYR